MTEAKRLAGEKAIDYIEDGMIVGVGTGSTVAFFIEALGRVKHRIKGAVSSSEQSSARLQALGIEVLDLNATGPLALYVDGADECDPHKRLIKGGGAALTREKIIAAASKTFVCMIDASKRVDLLGRFPLPIEVIPMARSYVAREIVRRERLEAALAEAPRLEPLPTPRPQGINLGVVIAAFAIGLLAGAAGLFTAVWLTAP